MPGVILTGERMSRHPSQQRQPGLADIDGKLPTGGGDSRSGGYACLLKPARYGQTRGELTAIIWC